MPSQSLIAPEKILVTEVVASATPSIRPNVKALAPSPPTSSIGSRLAVISELVSMNRLVKPSIHTLRGRLRNPIECSQRRPNRRSMSASFSST